MNRILSVTLALLIGAGIGWYAGYTRPIAKANREFMTKMGLPDQDIRKLLREIEVVGESMVDEEQFAALNALNALMQLSTGDQERAKVALLRPIRNFYSKYGPISDTSKKRTAQQDRLLLNIERFASHNSEFKQRLTAAQE